MSTDVPDSTENFLTDLQQQYRRSAAAVPVPVILKTRSLLQTPAPNSRGRKRAERGQWILITCVIAWFVLNNAGVIYQLGQQSDWMNAKSPSDIDRAIKDVQSQSTFIWFFATLGHLSVAGIFSGLAMMVHGYADLFLEKQHSFEQRVEQQMNFVASGDIGTIHQIRGNKMRDNYDFKGVKGDMTAISVGPGASTHIGTLSIVKQITDNSQHMAAETKRAFELAAAAANDLSLPSEDKADVADNLKKCAEELDKPAPEPNRIVRFVNRIEEIAPTVASILKSVAAVSALFI